MSINVLVSTVVWLEVGGGEEGVVDGGVFCSCKRGCKCHCVDFLPHINRSVSECHQRRKGRDGESF